MPTPEFLDPIQHAIKKTTPRVLKIASVQVNQKGGQNEKDQFTFGGIRIFS